MGARTTDELPWVPAENGYSLALDELTLVVRNPKGANAVVFNVTIADHDGKVP
jgi:hypothetical protein